MPTFAKESAELFVPGAEEPEYVLLPSDVDVGVEPGAVLQNGGYRCGGHDCGGGAVEEEAANSGGWVVGVTVLEIGSEVGDIQVEVEGSALVGEAGEGDEGIFSGARYVLNCSGFPFQVNYGSWNPQL